jgi:protein TIF31
VIQVTLTSLNPSHQRGDYPPINPHEDPKAHMHLISNIFVTKAVNSVDAYTHLGGDEAAHVSHAKDAAGVRLLNKLDIDNVYLLGHTVVDWQGERWVCQSVLPGIFSRKRDDNEGLDEDEEVKVEQTAAVDSEKKEDWVEVNGTSPKVEQTPKLAESSEELDEAAGDSENYLIIYGADSEGGLNHLHWDAGMHKVMKKIASAQRLALHKMQSTQGEEHEFWTSVDVKGLRGSDSRRYLLDLPRLSPVDVEWLEKDMGESEESYPHRVVLLRPELIETFWEHSLKVWARQVQSEKAEKEKAQKEAASSEETRTDAETDVPTDEKLAANADSATSIVKDSSDLPQKFELRFNADAFVEQPKAFGDSDAASDGLSYVPESQKDESDPTIKAVRNASVFLRNIAVPAMLIDIVTSNSFGVMDGVSLSKQMHVRGINMRYLGLLMQTIEKTLAGTEVEAVGLLKAMRVSRIALIVRLAY